jgi:hypothetical protein
MVGDAQALAAPCEAVLVLAGTAADLHAGRAGTDAEQAVHGAAARVDRIDEGIARKTSIGDGAGQHPARRAAADELPALLPQCAHAALQQSGKPVP